MALSFLKKQIIKGFWP